MAVAPVIAARLPAADALELVRPVHISISVLTLAGMLFVRCLAEPRGRAGACRGALVAAGSAPVMG